MPCQYHGRTISLTVMSTQERLPVIIVGGGIVGLCLAQALKKEGIPFRLYERDQYLDSRSAGWGITIHWALQALETCLPPDLFQRIDSTQVDPQQGLQGALTALPDISKSRE